MNKRIDEAENDRKIKERLERSRETGGLGIDFGEVTLFTGSDGKVYKDLDKIDVVELACHRADNYSFVALENLHTNNLYNNPKNSKDKADKFFLFKKVLTDLMGKDLVIVSKDNTSKKCSFCGELTETYRRREVFRCKSCRFYLNADLNASHNIVDDGLYDHTHPFEAVSYLENLLKEKKICSVEGCEEFVNSNGLCKSHYMTIWRFKEKGTCKIENCGKKSFQLGFCSEDYYIDLNNRRKWLGKLCSIEGCENPIYGRGFCEKHYEAIRRSDKVVPRKGEKKPEVCFVEDCNRKYYLLGFCHFHYNIDLDNRNKELGKICKIEGCENPARVKGKCIVHYRVKRYSGNIEEGNKGCKIPGCQKKHMAQGFCQDHYNSATRNGVDEFNLPRIYTPGLTAKH